MADSTEPSETTIDLARMAKPDLDAFRYIATLLGARYAGDGADWGELDPLQGRHKAAARLGGGARDDRGADPRSAALLDCVPLPLLIGQAEAVAFANRAALRLLGHASSAALNAAGGLAALFGGQAACEAGVVALTTATGAELTARVSIAAVPWGRTSAVLLTIRPVADAVPEPAEPADMTRADALLALLDANPDPTAIIAPNGQVVAANQAFIALGPAADLALAHRLAPGDLDRVLETVGHAFCLASGHLATQPEVASATGVFRPTAAPVAAHDLVCLVLHRGLAAGTDRPGRGSQPGDALATAIDETRRLVADAEVALLVQDGASDPAARAEAQPLYRLLLIKLVAKLPRRGAIKIYAAAEGLRIAWEPPDESLAASLSGSERIAALAQTAGLDLTAEADGLRIARTSPVHALRRDGLADDFGPQE